MRSSKILPLANLALTLGFLGILTSVSAQNSFTGIGGEYSIIEARSGDQLHNAMAIDANGGWIVWQDNVTDGDGLGISARHLNNSFSGDLSIFRVNQMGVGEQENPAVALLQDGGAVFVWQGGKDGFQEIYARFMSSNMTFRTGDVLINTYTNQQQVHPSVAVLANGNVVITWQSYMQDGSLFGVYGQVMSPAGAPVGAQFNLNQTTALNQRDCVVAPLANGNFVAAWASERSTVVVDTNNPASQFKVDIKGRVFTSAGSPVAGEFVIAQGGICANPSLAALQSGGFVASWSQMSSNLVDRWDVACAAFDSLGVGVQAPALVNSTLVGDQAGPHLAVTGANLFCVWTSMGQDGSQEGVYGRRVDANGIPVGTEMLVNTTTRSGQLQPTVASDANGHFVVAWSSFVGLSTFCDLFAQRFAADSSSGLLPPPAPYVFALSASSLNVTWAEVSGYPVDYYQLYMDGSSSPIVVSNIQTTITNLSANSTHGFRLAYHLTNGMLSSLSASASGTTWGADNNSDGMPDGWQSAYWGGNSASWPSAQADSDGDGASNLMEFLAGTNPTDPDSVLRAFLKRNGSGFAFSWKTQPGMVYQLQSAVTLNGWQDVGLPRFAHGYEDSVLFPAGSQAAFYRVIRLR